MRTSFIDHLLTECYGSKRRYRKTGKCNHIFVATTTEDEMTHKITAHYGCIWCPKEATA